MPTQASIPFRGRLVRHNELAPVSGTPSDLMEGIHGTKETTKIHMGAEGRDRVSGTYERQEYRAGVDLLLTLVLHASLMRSDSRPYQVRQVRLPANSERLRATNHLDLGHRGLALQRPMRQSPIPALRGGSACNQRRRVLGPQLLEVVAERASEELHAVLDSPRAPRDYLARRRPLAKIDAMSA
jgi:hypothetical protein